MQVKKVKPCGVMNCHIAGRHVHSYTSIEELADTAKGPSSFAGVFIAITPAKIGEWREIIEEVRAEGGHTNEVLIKFGDAEQSFTFEEFAQRLGFEEPK